MVAANWNAPAFNDNLWASGAAPLGYGDAHIVTNVGYGPNANNKYTTTWFRTTFSLQNAASVVAATMDILRDDGAVVYLNGVEVARTNMPNGAINANTLATQLVLGADETTWFTYVVNPATLVNGTNVVAIEVHQQVLNSSDLGIDVELTLTQIAP